MRRSEVARKFDEIVAFAEVEKFIDTPVKRYSSGMYVRLAFAVAAHMETEILLVDEVLAAGDVQFQEVLGRIGEVAKHGRTVLFISHNMAAVKSLTTTGIVLAEGRVRFNQTAEAAVQAYVQMADSTVSSTTGSWGRGTHTQSVRFGYSIPLVNRPANTFPANPFVWRWRSRQTVLLDVDRIVLIGLQNRGLGWRRSTNSTVKCYRERRARMSAC